MTWRRRNSNTTSMCTTLRHRPPKVQVGHDVDSTRRCVCCTHVGVPNYEVRARNVIYGSCTFSGAAVEMPSSGGGQKWELRYVGKWERKKPSELSAQQTRGHFAVPYRSQTAMSASDNVGEFLTTLGFRQTFQYKRSGTRWTFPNGITVEATRMKEVGDRCDDLAAAHPSSCQNSRARTTFRWTASRLKRIWSRCTQSRRTTRSTTCHTRSVDLRSTWSRTLWRAHPTAKNFNCTRKRSWPRVRRRNKRSDRGEALPSTILSLTDSWRWPTITMRFNAVSWMLQKCRRDLGRGA
ncbi:hypothetical protein, variant 1 [Aphanomyces invadans]|uniref:Mediator of RNA polymerase II transcription subunit 18 n=1 Tax=Aphanomyces invadans TaxID=157072 RepID=A0A024U036_9STRA|nr:hypothetical protein, variant 1 [Aphanomyces invadans]ETV98942.1 hypothetical protein, variant 1 [Aphanomyces invadans]|eukprot:XP_008872369.1 hypothetical protein, variant 1 [Aphanomyces invadans]